MAKKTELSVRLKFQSDEARRDLDKVKEHLKGLSDGISIDTSSIKGFKDAFKDIAKSFGEDLKKVLRDLDISEVGTAKGTSKKGKVSKYMAEAMTRMGMPPTTEKLEEVMGPAKTARATKQLQQALAINQKKLNTEIQAEDTKQKLKDDKNRAKEEKLKDKYQNWSNRGQYAKYDKETGNITDFGGKVVKRGGGGEPITPSNPQDIRSSVTSIIRSPAFMAAVAAPFGLEKFRQTYAQYQNQPAMDAIQGNYLEGQVRQMGREENSVSKWGGAGAGALMGGKLGFGAGGPLGAAVGIVAGGISGYIAGSTLRGETKVEEARPALELSEYARSLRAQRLNTAAGAGYSERALSGASGIGATKGFMPQESLGQLNAAKQALGGDLGMYMLSPMQRRERGFGVGVGEQASIAESLIGTTGIRGKGGVQAQIEIMKKGMAAGIDSSKLIQFVKGTTEFLQQSGGLGRMQGLATAQDLADKSQISARGELVTTADMNRAKTAAAMQLSDTRGQTNEGFGILETQKIAKDMGLNLNTAQMLSLSRLGKNAEITPEIEKTIGKDKETIQKFMDRKKGGGVFGTDLLGQIGQYAMAKESNIGLEEQQAMYALNSSKASPKMTEDEAGKQIDNITKSVEALGDFKNLVAEANVAHAKHIEGFVFMKVATDAASLSLHDLKEKANKLKDVFDEISKNAAATGHQ